LKLLINEHAAMAKTPGGVGRALRIYEKARPGCPFEPPRSIDEVPGWLGEAGGPGKRAGGALEEAGGRPEKAGGSPESRNGGSANPGG
jgi:hypothetical protein